MQFFNHAFAYAMATIHTTGRRHQERGASMVEYVVLVVIIAGVVAVVIGIFGAKITKFVTDSNLPTSATTPAATPTT